MKRMLQEEKRLREEIQEMLEEAEATDREEDECFGRNSRGDELSEELRRQKDRLAKIQKAKADLEKEAKQGRAEEAQTPEGMPDHRPKTQTNVTPQPKAQRNFTDPESRIMEKGGEFLQGYNCHLSVEEANQLIVAQGLVNDASDNGNVGSMTRKATRNTGEAPDAMLADSAYWSEEAPEEVEELGTEAYIATGRGPHGKKTPSCSKAPPEEASTQEKMTRKLQTREGLNRYARRKAIVEPAIGQIKETGSVRRFPVRGLEKARWEWALVCTGHNLRKLYRAFQAGKCTGGLLGSTASG